MANHATACLKPQVCLEFWKPNQIGILLSKSVLSHGDFPEVCMDPNTRSWTPESVTGQNRKLKPGKLLSSAESICSYNKAVDF